LRTVKPIDFDLIFKSVSKTGRILALDTGVSTGSIAGEIIARVSMDCHGSLKYPPKRIAMPDFPTPTSIALTKSFYKRAEDIIDTVSSMMGMSLVGSDLIDRENIKSDVPGEWFKGPF